MILAVYFYLLLWKEYMFVWTLEKRKKTTKMILLNLLHFPFIYLLKNIDIESHPFLLIYFLLLITTGNSFINIFPNISVCSRGHRKVRRPSKWLVYFTLNNITDNFLILSIKILTKLFLCWWTFRLTCIIIPLFFLLLLKTRVKFYKEKIYLWYTTGLSIQIYKTLIML